MNSLYLRILAKHPQIRGRHRNLAQRGGTVTDLVSQAKRPVSLRRKPELVVIFMDNDLVCPLETRELRKFRATFVSALKVLARGTRRTRFFVVSQFGSPTTYWKALNIQERASAGGTCACDFLDPAGELVPTKLTRLEKAIHGYEAQLAGASASAGVDTTGMPSGASSISGNIFPPT